MKLLFNFLMLLMCMGMFNVVSQAQSHPHHHATGHSCSSSHVQSLKEATDPDFKRRQKEVDDQLRQMIYGANPVSRAAGTVYTIPVVVHVVHFTGTPVGTNENLSDATIQQGIDDMNDAFRNIGFYDPLTGADVEIEFCLASQDPLGNFTTGITRTANNALTDLDSDTEDATLKATVAQWDPLSYCNIWLVDEICSSGSGSCGTAGYAYLAGAHGQSYDGIVNEAAFFGTSQNNSKVHIHEMGHYLNLSHTFEGCTNNDCTTDGDQVCDTPPDNATTAISCGSTTNSCTTDEDDTSLNNPFRAIGLGGLGEQNDMFQNYMDYGFQSCQDRFTDGQKTRMRTALTGVRASLLSSSGCVNPSAPEIYFSTAATAVSETGTTSSGSCLMYRDITVNMDIAAAPTGDADVTISYAGTASGNGADYTEGTGPEISFPSGSTNTQSFTLRIWDDLSIEGDETIILTYSISGTTDASPSSFNQTMTITISDDDKTPDVAGKNVLLDEDFEAGIPGTWGTGLFFACECVNRFVTGSNGIPGSQSAYISMDGGTTYGYNNTSRWLGLSSPVLDATGVSTDLILSVDMQVDGDANDYAEIRVKSFGAFGSSSWFSLGAEYTPLTNINGNYRIILPTSLHGNTFEIGFFWTNDGATVTGNPLAIDNVQIFTENQPSNVETVLCSNEVPFGPNATVYIYNGTENDLVARVTNNSSWDYGCTTFDIDRTGSSAQQYQNGATSSYVTDKTLLITPTNNNPSGNYEIRIYYSAAEVAGWEAATGENRADMTLFKATNAISTATGTTELGVNPVNGTYNGADFYVQADFSTGFSGFAAHSQNFTPLPIQLASFQGALVENAVQLDWQTEVEINNDFFSLERSADGVSFEVIAELKAEGNTQQKKAYQYLDEQPLPGYNYYRLKQTDFDGNSAYIGQVIAIEYVEELDVRMEPNPVRNGQFNLYYPVQQSGQSLNAQIFSLDGRLIKDYHFDLEKGVNSIHFNINDLSEGVYLLKTTRGGVVQKNFRVVMMR